MQQTHVPGKRPRVVYLGRFRYNISMRVQSLLVAAALLLTSACCREPGLVPIPDAGVADAGEPADSGPIDAGCAPNSWTNCYMGPAGTEGVGICHDGVNQCRADGTWSGCLYEQDPEPEQCNCLDNNCDGIVGNIPDTQFCYDGPDGTAGVGSCHPGVEACGSGSDCSQTVCRGEQLPAPDQCDGLDSECNGQPLQTQDTVDIVFLLENTDIGCEDAIGSTEFFQSQQTLLTFMGNHQQPNFHYAVITLPGCPWPKADDAGYTLLVPGFEPESQVQGPAENSCLIEPVQSPECVTGEPVYLWDIIYQQALGQLVPWEPGARRAIVAFLGDEGESNGACPGNSICGILEVQQALQDSGAIFVAFVTNGFESDYNFWHVPGETLTMSTDDAMGPVLDQQLVFPCGSDAGVSPADAGGVVVDDGGAICTCVGTQAYCQCDVNGVWETCTAPFIPLPNPCVDGG